MTLPSVPGLGQHHDVAFRNSGVDIRQNTRVRVTTIKYVTAAVTWLLLFSLTV